MNLHNCVCLKVHPLILVRTSQTFDIFVATQVFSGNIFKTGENSVWAGKQGFVYGLLCQCSDVDIRRGSDNRLGDQDLTLLPAGQKHKASTKRLQSPSINMHSQVADTKIIKKKWGIPTLFCQLGTFQGYFICSL